MSFDQNMIIDATTGSIARFVNHSCNPNCRMIKWIVSGQPRMALFAGDKPITTGEELTYDYNFDPFSAKNVQKCLCGEPNCRGVLGPKPREVKPPKTDKTDLKAAVKAKVKAGKRKLKELVGDEGDADATKAKKRKIQPATGAKRSLGSKVVKTAATALKKVTIKTSTTSKAKSPNKGKSPARRRASASVVLKKATTATRIIKTYGKTATTSPRQRAASGSSSVTVATGTKTPKGKPSPTTKRGSTRKVIVRPRSASLGDVMAKVASPRRGLDLSRAGEIRVVQDD